MKILNGKSYGSIPHLPGSRRGPSDRGLSESQARIATERVRDKNDVVIVQEKLDGSNVGVVNLDGRIIAIGRAGYLAASSPYLQHRMFANWVAENEDRFRELLCNGERVCGEWLSQAHGTRYKLKHEPFVAFDIISGDERLTYRVFTYRVTNPNVRLTIPAQLNDGMPMSVEEAMAALGKHGHHGALDEAEGAVWRVERTSRKCKITKVDFLAKYVRADKVDGKYFPEISGEEIVWNWQPEKVKT